MNCYYAQHDQKLGPVDAAELIRLASAGTVAADTLVWCEGMANWEPYAQANPAPPPLTKATVSCSGCGQTFGTEDVIRVGADLVCAACKPVAVQKLREGVSVNPEAEGIRQTHIQHEASIRSVGILYLVGGVVMGFAALSTTIRYIVAASSAGPQAAAYGITGMVIFLVLLALAVFQFGTGIGLRKLKPWSRTLSAVISCVGLIAFPIGTLINGYILYLLFSKQGGYIFSADYQRIIAATPHVKYKTSRVVWIILGLLLVVLGGVIVWAASSTN